MSVDALTATRDVEETELAEDAENDRAKLVKCLEVIKSLVILT